MTEYIIFNACIINENQDYIGSLHIKEGKIDKIYEGVQKKEDFKNFRIIDATNKLLIPGVIDNHVHFREPGLEHKADIYTESKAAVAGGVTSYMEMPNTIPQATSIELLEKKIKIAEKNSLANYSFYLGATNNNKDEIKKIDSALICGLKLFLGASTGNMLVDNQNSINWIFQNCKVPIIIHSEDSKIITKNLKAFKEKYGKEIPMDYHNTIRSEEACYKTTEFAVKLAKKYNTQIHIAHMTTERELSLFENDIHLKDKKITTEVCPQHIWFSQKDYKTYGTKIKCNPSIKTENDKKALLNGLLNNKIDIISSDHAPHLLEEKDNNYINAPSGIPIIQFTLPVFLELAREKKISINKIVEKMCHNPAFLFNIHRRGFIREKYWADMVLIDLNNSWKVNTKDIISKCKWSPFENFTFNSKITHTFVNGNLVYKNGVFDEESKGKRLMFKRN